MTGRLVFKPVTDARLHALLASILNQIQGRDDLRIIRPVPNTDGNWSAGGWCAWEYLEGETDGSRWRDALVVSDLFHAAVAGVAHDPVVPGQHPWAMADRFAWGETGIEVPRSLRDGIERLCAIRRPVDLPIQLIHGDLGGNILYHPALPPAVIDISPYWRPKPYADAIAVVDAIAWAGADLSALDAIGPDAEQADLTEPMAALTVPSAEVIQVDGPRQRIRFRQDQTTAAEVLASVVAQATLRDLAVEEPSIEDVIRHMYEGRANQ